MADLKPPANDDLARAMFYLYCTTAACGLDVLPRDLVDYENYSTLPNARRECVLLAACAFAPAVMKRRTLFEDVDRMFLDRKSRVRIVPFDEARGLLRACPIIRLRGANASLTAVVVVQRLSWADSLLRGVAQRVSSNSTSPSFTSSSSPFSAPTCNNSLARALRAHCSHCLWRGPCQCVTYGGKMYACTRPCYARCAPFPANLWTHRNHCAHCMGHAGKCHCKRSCGRPKGVSCFQVIPGVCDECLRKVSKVVVCQFACCDEPVRVCEVCFSGQAFVWWHAFCERDLSLQSPLSVPQRRTFVPITATAATTPALPAYDAGDNLVEGDVNKLDGYMQNGEGDNNQSLMVNTSIAPTAGSASININTETNGDGGIVMPGVVRENGRHDDYKNRLNQPVARFGATNVIECTKSFTRHSSITNCTTSPIAKTSAADSIQQVPIPVSNSEGVTSNTVRCVGNRVSSRFITNNAPPNQLNSIHAQIPSNNSTEFETLVSDKTGLVSMRRMACGLTHRRPPVTPADRPPSAVSPNLPSHRHRVGSPLLSQDASLPFHKGDRVKLINLAPSEMDGATGVVIIPRAKPGRVGVALTHAHDTRVVFVKLENLTPLSPLNHNNPAVCHPGCI